MIIFQLSLAAIVAGLTAFDNVHALQWMLSRPIVTGTLIGAVMGDIASGMLCGAMIELIWLGVLPIGNYTPPDAALTAAVAATASAIWCGGNPHAELIRTAAALLAVLACVPVGILSKLIDLQLRHSLAVRAEELLKTEPPYATERLVLVGLAPIFFKAALGVIFVGVASIVIQPAVVQLISARKVAAGLNLSASLVPALGMVQLSRCIGAKGRGRWVILGAGFTVLVFVLARVI